MDKTEPGVLIQYDYKREKEFIKKHSRNIPVFPESTPKIGLHWRYFCVSPEPSNNDFNRVIVGITKRERGWFKISYSTITKGKIIHIDHESGVYITDAGEILIPG